MNRTKNKSPNLPKHIFDPLPFAVKAEWVCNQEVGTTCKACPRKEPTMYADLFEYNDVAEAKHRLLSRVTIIEDKTKCSLLQKFGLEDDDCPYDGRELVKRILDGRYVLPDQEGGWSGNLFNIKWRDPKKTPDKDGFDAVVKTLCSLTTAVKDDIFVLPPADGLASLRKYEKDAAALLN